MFRARKGTAKKPSTASKARQVDGDDAPEEVLHAEPSLSSVSSTSGGVDEDVHVEQDDDSVDAIRARIKQKQRKQADFSSKKVRKPTVLASFEDEDGDGPAFRVRKGKIPRMSVEQDASAASPSRDLYSVENLNALKAQQRSFPSAPAPSSPVSPSPEPAPLPASPAVDYGPTTDFAEETFIPLHGSPRSSRRQPSPLPTDDDDSFHPRSHRPEEAFLDNDANPDGANDDDDYPADMQWEAEQLRRVGIHPTPSSAHSFSSTNEDASSQLSFQSFGQLLTKLQATHASLLDQMDLRSRGAQRADIELNMLTASIAAVDAELATCGAAFDEMQRLWEFLTTLCHCLRAKVRAVDQLDRASDSPESDSTLVHPRQVQSNVWVDVDDEFASLDAVLLRFTQWKTHPHTAASFDATYAALALEQLVVPYIRVELLSYSPWLHRWEDLDWVDAVRSFDLDPNNTNAGTSKAREGNLIAVGVDLVVAKALRMVRHFDWQSRVHADHAVYLLQSAGSISLQQQIADALVEWATAQPLPSMTIPVKRVFRKHLTMLRLPRTNALVVQLCQDELAHVQDTMKTNPAMVLALVEEIVKDWPTYCTEARPILMQYAVLVNNLPQLHQPDALVAKQAVLINIELKLKSR